MESFIMERALSIMVMGLFTVLFSIPFFTWKSACISAQIYNQAHNTTWSCSDFFWAGNQINSQTQTINLNN